MGRRAPGALCLCVCVVTPSYNQHAYGCGCCSNGHRCFRDAHANVPVGAEGQRCMMGHTSHGANARNECLSVLEMANV